MSVDVVEATADAEPAAVHGTREGTRDRAWPRPLAEPREEAWASRASLPLQLALKRIFDAGVATAGLAVMALPMALIALAIRIDSGGPVLFSQERIGRDGKPFKMYKFRSMVVNAELLRAGLWSDTITDSALFKVRHDPRRTRVGQLIRRFSLDEIPQLVNILRGQMSLVGPRPALAEEVERYDAYCAQRLLAVPGLTGLWQVSGRSECSFEEMMDLDLQYVSRWSLWSDFMIILRTIPVVISGKGAY